jgi:hypothetical protein
MGFHKDAAPHHERGGLTNKTKTNSLINFLVTAPDADDSDGSKDKFNSLGNVQGFPIMHEG